MKPQQEAAGLDSAIIGRRSRWRWWRRPEHWESGIAAENVLRQQGPAFGADDYAAGRNYFDDDPKTTVPEAEQWRASTG